MAEARQLAVVVLGATGVTGRQAVPYLRERAAELGFSWGIAGRDRERLEALVAGWPERERPERVVLDLADRRALAELAGRCAAIVNFAGPFARMAPPVIEAAVEAGIGYLDVSGEIDFVAETVERRHAAAERSGARIVEVAGFESLPFDLAVRLGIERLAELHDERPEAIEVVFRGRPPPGRPRASDLVSHGTFESLREAIAGDRAHVLGDPAALLGSLGAPERVRELSPIGNAPRWKRGVGPLAPMIPSPIINPPVIQRSLALLGEPPVRYREAVATSSLVPTRPAQAVVAGLTGALNAATMALSRAPARVRRAGARIAGVLSPAGGPREDRLEGWVWSLECEVRAASGATAEVRVEAEGHPGYLATSRMTAEAGLILADPDAPTPGMAGCLTPSTALGTAVLDRFEHARVRFI